MTAELERRVPRFEPPKSGPRQLDWAALPEAARKRMVETMRHAVAKAMSAKAPGPHIDLSKFHRAILKLRDAVDAASERVRETLDPADPYGPTLDRIRRLMANVAVEVGQVPLVDPMGPSRMVPHSIRFYVALAPRSGLVGQALPGHGYVYYIDYDLLQDVADRNLPREGLEAWKAFVLQNMAHELTHLVQAAFYPAAFSDYPEGGRTGPAYQEHPTEREARWASIDALLRMHGPTAEFWRAMQDLFGDELKSSKGRMLGLVRRYKERILGMAGSLVTADTIARRLGLTEKAMRAFMEQMEPHEGRLETVEQDASDSRWRVLMLVAPKEFWEVEYFAPRTLFAERGFDVSVATSGKTAEGAQGTVIEADLDVADADPADYDALFVSGGKGMIPFSENEDAQRLLKGFMDEGKPVALVCHAPLLAAKVGLAKGRGMTGWPEIRPEMVEAGAEWTGMPVERDGDLFTAVGPDDAEPLADILARRLDKAPTLAPAEALLDEKAAMRKLAALWRFADNLGDKPMSDEEAIRLLKEFERQEFEEPEPVVPAAPKAPLPPPPSPEKVTPDPERRGHKLRGPAAAWNIAIELHSPATGGSWPEVAASPPPGFPFSAGDFADGASIRALFQKPETWEALRELASNPAKRGMIQSYLVPAVVLAVGKVWWDINKHRKSVGNAPFGLFSSEEYKTFQDAGADLDETDAGRAFISIVNWRVAKILQYYLATGTPDGNLDGYIYASLNRRMMADAAKRQGFDRKLKPVCNYCRHKRTIQTTPPILAQTVMHQTKEEGKVRQRPLFRCPTCADLIDTKEKELRLKEQGASNAMASMKEFAEKIEKAQAELEQDPGNEDLRTRVKSLSDMRDTLGPQAEALAAERDRLRGEVADRRRMLDVPYQHLSCINENCPGQAIPLTFVDWEDPFWSSPEGAEARRMMDSTYGVAQAGRSQSAEDKPADEAISETAGKVPPEWLWDVPFRCPFDNARFTPREAFGRGKKDPRGRRMGGLFVDPPRTTIWWKPQSLEPTDPEAAHQRVEETRRQTGVEETTGTNEFLADQNEKLYYLELATSLRQEFYRRLMEHTKRTKGVEGKRTAALEALLYEAALEWSYVHPIHLVGYFTKRMPVKRKVVDKETGEVRDHLEVRSLPPGGAEQIIAGLIQTWFTKVLQQKNGWEMLRPYLANEGQDRVPPRCYFLSVAKRSGDVLEAECGLRYGKGSPLGEKSSRGTTYEKQGKNLYMALVEGIWDHTGAPSATDMMTPIPPDKGAAMTKGRTSHLDEMDMYDSRRIVFDSATSLTEGAPILVKALFMPRHTAWLPIRRVMNLRKDLADMDDEMSGIMDAIGRLADENEDDVRLFARWRKALRQLGMPEQLEKFDEALRKRLEEKGK